MTKEQIADVRRRIDLSPGAITEPMVRNIELARLLDEREALLGALHGLIEFANSPAAKAVDMSAWLHGVKYRPEDVAAWDVARAAIAKAEAP